MLEITEIGGAEILTAPLGRTPRHTELPQAGTPLPPKDAPPAATPLGGQSRDGTHAAVAAQSSSDEGQLIIVNQTTNALVGNLTMETRRYTDLRRAHQRLLLQAMAMCRYSCDGDKDAGAKLFALVMKEPTHPLRLWIKPYLDAMLPLEDAIDAQAKTIARLAKQLPVADWAKGVAGLSERFLGLIVGECGAPVGEFRNPSCVWKRMGMAVIDGGRQRKVVGDAAVEHGYVARRRALMWNIGESIIKQQVRKHEDGTRCAIGELGQVYIDRRAYLEARDGEDVKRVHTNAKRYMEKRLLRQLWQAWRAPLIIRPTITPEVARAAALQSHLGERVDS